MESELLIVQIEEVLEELRPTIKKDGGDVQFVSVQDGVVSVRLSGACIGCPFSTYTLKLGIFEKLKAKIPSIKNIIAVE